MNIAQHPNTYDGRRKSFMEEPQVGLALFKATPRFLEPSFAYPSLHAVGMFHILTF